MRPITSIFSFLLLFVVTFNGVSALYRALHPARPPSGMEGSLMALPLFAAALFGGMLLSNALFFSLPAVRRVLEATADSAEGARFRAAKERLWRTARVVIPVCVGLAVLGAVAPWAA